NARAVAARMPLHVREGLLDDPERRHLDFLGEPSVEVGDELDVDSRATLERVQMVLDRLCEAHLVEEGRVKERREVAQLSRRLLRKLAAVGQETAVPLR